MTGAANDGMTGTVLILGLGYSAGWLARRLLAAGWTVIGANRSGRAPEGFTGAMLAIDDAGGIATALAQASHVLSSVPPDPALPPPHDPVLARMAAALQRWPGRWIGYLSSTGVYGDTQGAWVDETSPVAGGPRQARTTADLAWQALGQDARAPVDVFRIAGIYGPGRSPFDRLRAGDAVRIHAPGHVFSRIHVDDIATTVAAAMVQPAPHGVRLFNLCDDEAAEAATVLEHAAMLLGVPPPPLVPLEQAQLSPMARSFYTACRRVRNDKIKRDLGVQLAYPDYRDGLAAILAQERER